MVKQNEIYVALKDAMVEANCLSEKDAQVEGWTTVHERAWFSFTYHKLGLFPTPQIPMNELQMEALVPSMRRLFASVNETQDEASQESTPEQPTEQEQAGMASEVTEVEDMSVASESQDNDNEVESEHETEVEMEPESHTEVEEPVLEKPSSSKKKKSRGG